jgi:hypothetical protein
MTQVKVLPERASQEIINKAAAEVVITDARGRKIALKKPNVLSEFRFVEFLGESAENRVYVSMAMPMIYVTSIDGELIAPPSSKLQLEAVISRLDDDGVKAVLKGVSENFQRPDGEEFKEAVKKD